MTSMSAWLLMISVIKPRTRAESSTHNSRIFFIAISAPWCRVRALINSLPTQAEIAADIRKILGMAGKQQTARLQERHKALQDACLSGLVEINHDVPAEDRVKLFGNRPRRRQQVQGLETHHRSQFGPHALVGLHAEIGRA